MSANVATDSLFDHDTYLIRHRASVLSDVHEILSADDALLATVRAPVRWLRSWIGGCVMVIAWLAGWSAAAFAIGELLERFGMVPQHPKDGMSAAIGLGGLLASLLPAYLVSLAVLPRYRARFHAPGTAHPVLEVAEDRRFLPVRRRFTVSTPADGPIARCSKGNYPLLFGARWTCDLPDGATQFEVREAEGLAGLPGRVLRQASGGPRSGFVFRRPGQGGGEPLGVIVKADRGGDTVMLELAADSGPTVDRRAGLALAVLVESGGWR